MHQVDALAVESEREAWLLEVADMTFYQWVGWSRAEHARYEKFGLIPQRRLLRAGKRRRGCELRFQPKPQRRWLGLINLFNKRTS